MTFATLGDPWNGGRISFNTMYMNKVPIPEINTTLGSKIKEKVEYILANENSDIQKVEKEIDELVMDLYGLNEDEKEVIRNSIK
jgi:hypothetical protein